jgi:hypothetical protein
MSTVIIDYGGFGMTKRAQLTAARRATAIAFATLLAAGGYSLAATTSARAAEPAWYSNGVELSGKQAEEGLPIVGHAGDGYQTVGELTLNSPVIGEVRCAHAFISGTTRALAGTGRFTAVGCVAIGLEQPVVVTAELPPDGPAAEGEVCIQAGKRPSECPASSERHVVPVILGSRYAGSEETKPRFTRPYSVPWNERLAVAAWPPLEEEAIVDELGRPQEESGTCLPTSGRWNESAAGCVKLNVAIPSLGVEDVLYGAMNAVIYDGVRNGLSPSRLVLVGDYSGKPFDALHSDRNLIGEVSVSAEIAISGARSFELVTAK